MGKNDKKWVWGLCAAGCFGLIAESMGSNQVCVAGYVLGFLMMAILAVYMIMVKQRLMGVFVLAAWFSMAVMLVTNAAPPRVMLPCCYIFLLCVCQWGIQRIRISWKTAVLLISFAAVTAFCMVPVIKGYAHNLRIDMLNKQLITEARESQCIRYCTDYDMRYTWVKIDHDPYFRMKYLESCGMDENGLVIFFSQSDLYPHMIYIGDTALSGGVLTDEQGRVLLPLRQIVERLGGAVNWEEGKTVVLLGQNVYELVDLDDQTVRIIWSDENGWKRQQDIAACTYYTHAKYCDIEMFTQILNIPVLLDQEQFCYIIPE